MLSGERPVKRRLILCAGMQSGGTTLISWCFLQRRDTDGVLDMANDCIRASLDKAKLPIVWCKMTVGSFRWLDLAEFYGDLGWTVEPVLVVRDVRVVLSSLLQKHYGYNGKTGDRPPLRMRLRRFLRDWEMFRANGWPMITFEAFLADAPGVLRAACADLRLDWDSGMLTWPKGMSELAYPSPEPNATFLESIRPGGLDASLAPCRQTIDISCLPPAELDWLEEAFGVYNAFHGYPIRVSRTAGPDAPSAPALHERILIAEKAAEDAQ
jgi:hypothetical protein